MAAETGNTAVNGDYGTHQLSGATQQVPPQEAGATNASISSGASGTENPSVPGNAPQPSSTGNSNSIPKDEVGWYFVEQYYTTLSRSPEKLHVSEAL